MLPRATTSVQLKSCCNEHALQDMTSSALNHQKSLLHSSKRWQVMVDSRITILRGRKMKQKRTNINNFSTEHLFVQISYDLYQKLLEQHMFY